MPKQKIPKPQVPQPQVTIPASAIIVHTPTGDRPLDVVLYNILHGILTDCVRYRLDDIGFGNLYTDIYKYKVRYVIERKCWYVYDDIRWGRNDAAAMELCKQMTREVKDYCLQNLPPDNGNDVYKCVKKLTNRKSRETILEDASSVYPIHVSEFDKNPMLFNVKNGTLDLTTYTLRPHNPDDLMTKVANVTYEPSAICDRWIQHIREVTEGDDKLAEYMQKSFGSCLTGENPYECFFLLYGPTTRNGKSTTMETIMAMMGDYGTTSTPETIAQKQNYNGGGPSENIARLAGARIVNIPEPDKKLVLSSAMVKTLTGNDTITARYLHENSFEFRPTFKFFINTNHLPRIPDLTVFRSGRVKVIPFKHHFDAGSQDKNLKATLMQPHNQSGILNWHIEGLKLQRSQGFAEPQAVIEATAEYHHDSDKIALFLEDCMKPSPGNNTKMDDAYNVFQSWCSSYGIRAEGLPQFRKGLEAHVKIGRSRSVCGTKRPNPVACIFDYILLAQQNYYLTVCGNAMNAACGQAGCANPNVGNLADPQTQPFGNSNP